MPAALYNALLIEEMAQRYHCLPHEVLAAPAWLLKHRQVLNAAQKRAAPADGPADSLWFDDGE